MLRWVGGGHKAREEGPESWKHLWAPEGSWKCLGKAIPCRKPLPKLRTLYAGSKPSSLSHSPPRTQSPPTRVENRDTHPYKTPKHKCPLHKAPPPTPQHSKMGPAASYKAGPSGSSRQFPPFWGSSPQAGILDSKQVPPDFTHV